MRSLPGVAEHPLEVHLLFTVRTGLLLPDDAPATDAELVEHVVAGELVGILYDPFFSDIHKDFLSTDRTDLIGEMFGRHS